MASETFELICRLTVKARLRFCSDLITVYVLANRREPSSFGWSQLITDLKLMQPGTIFLPSLKNVLR